MIGLTCTCNFIKSMFLRGCICLYVRIFVTLEQVFSVCIYNTVLFLNEYIYIYKTVCGVYMCMYACM